MIWFYSQNQKRSSDFFRNVMSCRIELCEKARKNDNKNGIWNGHALSSSYAILFFRDIYWISLFVFDKWFVCWDTRIRTWKNRTRICCVTITPYPNFPIKTPVLILTLQRYGFLFNPQIFEAFFSNQDSFFLHLPSFPAFLILLDRVSSF